MPLIPPTSPATSRVQKRVREEEQEEYYKRQRQNGLQTPPGYPSDFASRYPEALLECTPRSSSSLTPPIHSAYLTAPETRLQNKQGIDTSYRASQDGLYAPNPTYGNPNGQFGLAVSPPPPPSPQLSYDYPGHAYQHDANGQLAPTMQAIYAPGLPVPQAQRRYGEYYPMHLSMVTSIPRQQQTIEQRLVTALSATDHCRDDLPSTTAGQAAWKELCAEQKQWLIQAEADLQDRTIKVIPAIPIDQGTLVAPSSINNGLVPSDVWRLRALSPLQRYGAYHILIEVASEMVMYEQASKEYQTRWTRIVNFRARLMQVEKAWADSFTQGTSADRWERWNQTLKEQAVNVPVDRAMVAEFEQSKIKARATSPGGVVMDNKTPRPLTSEPVSTKMARQNVQTPTSQPVVASIVPVKSAKPDTIKHPSDKTTVPKYPSDDINDFTCSPDTGLYKCMHEFETNKDCCKKGLDRSGIKQAIARSISTWKSRVEVLIEKGLLHKSHMTWTTYQNQRLRRDQKAVEKKRAEAEARDRGSQAERSVKKEKQQAQQKEKGDNCKSKCIEEGATAAGLATRIA